jgi:hypothetical protein
MPPRHHEFRLTGTAAARVIAASAAPRDLLSFPPILDFLSIPVSFTPDLSEM